MQNESFMNPLYSTWKQNGKLSKTYSSSSVQKKNTIEGSCIEFSKRNKQFSSDTLEKTKQHITEYMHNYKAKRLSGINK